MECWPRYVDPSDATTGKQYPGWPKTINMEDNYARKAYKWLPRIIIQDHKNPVIQVINEKSNEIIYTLRINGHEYDPKVLENGTYSVIINVPDSKIEKTFKGLVPNEVRNNETHNINLNDQL